MMIRAILLCIAILCGLTLHAQHAVQLLIKDKETGSPLAGATIAIPSLQKTVVSDSAGLAQFTGLAAGAYTIRVSHVGMEEKETTIRLPNAQVQPLEIFLEREAGEEEDNIVITATRSSRTIRDIPTRVETISGEELMEKANMKPGDIRMLLSESTGIQTQQTSATSAASSIRIQGLDGRYTQVLRDGFPLYAGFSGGLSLMQVAPLDLRQVEVIKGSSSTLYGGGAMAGLVNLVSKEPVDERELSFMANATSARGLDLSGFYSQRFDKTGLTVFSSANYSTPYDPAGIGLTAIPRFSRYTIQPKFFIYGKNTTLKVGFSYVTEARTGGSMSYIKDDVPGYFERNNTRRGTTQIDLQHRFNERTSLQFKNSYSGFYRKIAIPAYLFEGRQQSSYSELNLNTRAGRTTWIAGLNLLTDDFSEVPHATTALRNYHYNTWGLFLQNTWTPAGKLSLETGLRGDYVRQYGFEWLPRIALLYKAVPALTIRLGGGMGYKTPSVFNEDAEKRQFQNILPINEATARNERSTGANLDFNYRTNLGALGFSGNLLFYYTRLNHPLVMQDAGSGNYQFVNANGHIDTRGLETNLKFRYHDFKLFVGYTYADANTHYDNSKSWLPLTARHRLNNVLMYEKEDNIKIGLEAYYFSPQQLSDGAMGRSYWICGFMVEKALGPVSLFINFENFLDVRQTRFDTIYTGSIDNPVFRDIYAPVDGFVVNGGFKLRL